MRYELFQSMFCFNAANLCWIIETNIGYFWIAATKAALEPDKALYIGLSVALVVIVPFAIFGAVMLKIIRRKHAGHSPMFPVGTSGRPQKQFASTPILNFIDRLFNIVEGFWVSLS